MVNNLFDFEFKSFFTRIILIYSLIKLNIKNEFKFYKPKLNFLTLHGAHSIVIFFHQFGFV